VIYYSATDKSKTVEAARGASDASTIGHKPQQELYWNVDRENRKEVALMGVRVTNRQQKWTVYIHFSRKPV
jgi:hypothetical protein